MRVYSFSSLSRSNKYGSLFVFLSCIANHSWQGYRNNTLGSTVLTCSSSEIGSSSCSQMVKDCSLIGISSSESIGVSSAETFSLIDERRLVLERTKGESMISFSRSPTGESAGAIGIHRRSRNRIGIARRGGSPRVRDRVSCEIWIRCWSWKRNHIDHIDE